MSETKKNIRTTPCPCCGKQISPDSEHCIYCGEPMNKVEKYEPRFSYEYEGETLMPAYTDDIIKLDILQKIKKVKIDKKIYNIKDFICNSNDEIIHVILDDENEVK